MRNHVIFIYFIFISVTVNAGFFQDPVMRIIPGLSVGYTFGHGINMGVDVGISFLDYKIGKVDAYAGAHISYAVFTHERELYKNGYYRVFALNLMNVVNEQYILKLGLARTKLKWGVNSINKSYSNGWGLNIDMAFKPVLYSPLLGFRYFKLNNVCMGIGVTNPKFLYTGYNIPFNVTTR